MRLAVESPLAVRTQPRRSANWRSDAHFRSASRGPLLALLGAV